VALSQKKSRKLWIWKAFDCATGSLLDWEGGHRDQRTFKKLDKRFKHGNANVYSTAEYQVSSAIIPKRRLVMSKHETKAMERHHTPNRHWLARFKRKSMVVSKSLEIIDLTMALFAKFHVNRDEHLLLNALQT
jgi:insertion element IS1 protein InsB